MFFLSLLRWRHYSFPGSLQKLILMAQAVILTGLPLAIMYPLALLLELLGRSLFPALNFEVAARIFLDLGLIVVFVVTLEKLIHYRLAPMLIVRLNFSQEAIEAQGLKVTKGMPVAELMMGELYDYARYWRLKLTPRELTVFLYRDTYKGLLKLIEKMKSGWRLIPPTAVIMIYTPLLKEEYAERVQAVVSPKELRQEDLRRRSLWQYRLKMFLATRISPFSKDIPIPKFYRRGYLLPKSLLPEELERDLRAEIARLSLVTEEILAKKKKKLALARLGY